MKYAGLGLGRIGARGGGGEVNGSGDDECETTGSPPKIEKRNRRQSLSRLLMDRDKEIKSKDTDAVLEKEKLIGRHKETRSGAGGFVGVGGGPPACILRCRLRYLPL